MRSNNAWAQLVHRRAIQVGPGIDIEIPRPAIGSAPRVVTILIVGTKGKVGDGAVASDKEDGVTAAGHLPGNAFQVVARTVHKVETSPFERLAVLNGVV